jgi:hypothetical protein
VAAVKVSILHFSEKDLEMFLGSRYFENKFLVVMCSESGCEWCFMGV